MINSNNEKDKENRVIKPGRLRYFIASKWPIAIYSVLHMLFSSFVGYSLFMKVGFYLMETSLSTFIVSVILFLIFFALLWFLLLGAFISQIFVYFGYLNGGPFEKGDLVMILCGPHINRISRVYEKWQRNSVRVELSECDREEFRDVFAPHEIFKVPIHQPPRLLKAGEKV